MGVGCSEGREIYLEKMEELGPLISAAPVQGRKSGGGFGAQAPPMFSKLKVCAPVKKMHTRYFGLSKNIIYYSEKTCHNIYKILIKYLSLY